MIYIYETYCDMAEHYRVDSVWECDVNVQEEMSKFFSSAAKERNLVINPHYFNIMNFDHHKHLSNSEFKKATKEWAKFLSHWTTKRFLKEVLKAKKIEFERIL
jgi:hypothetical protein